MSNVLLGGSQKTATFETPTQTQTKMETELDARHSLGGIVDDSLGMVKATAKG